MEATESGAGLSDSAALAASEPPRERVSIDAGWRFQKGDPPENAVSLRYEALKQWILPTGDSFIGDAARRFARPPGNWGGDVAYLRGDFDDRSWQSVDLPHDWAIAGPFITGVLSDSIGLQSALTVIPAFGVLAAFFFLLAARSYEPDLQRIQSVTVDVEDVPPHGAPA